LPFGIFGDVFVAKESFAIDGIRSIAFPRPSFIFVRMRYFFVMLIVIMVVIFVRKYSKPSAYLCQKISIVLDNSFMLRHVL